VCGLELPQRQQPASISSQAGAQAQLVHTAAVDRNLEALAMGQCHSSSILLLRLLPCIAAAGSNAFAFGPAARGTGLQTNARLHPDPPCACFAGLCLGSPILLEGPPGSGKSALIEHIASLTGNAQGGFRCLPGCATAWQLLGALCWGILACVVGLLDGMPFIARLCCPPVTPATSLPPSHALLSSLCAPI
jgi:hypothetical protein